MKVPRLISGNIPKDTVASWYRFLIDPHLENNVTAFKIIVEMLSRYGHIATLLCFCAFIAGFVAAGRSRKHWFISRLIALAISFALTIPVSYWIGCWEKRYETPFMFSSEIVDAFVFLLLWGLMTCLVGLLSLASITKERVCLYYIFFAILPSLIFTLIVALTGRSWLAQQAFWEHFWDDSLPLPSLEETRRNLPPTIRSRVDDALHLGTNDSNLPVPARLKDPQALSLLGQLGFNIGGQRGLSPQQILEQEQKGTLEWDNPAIPAEMLAQRWPALITGDQYIIYRIIHNPSMPVEELSKIRAYYQESAKTLPKQNDSLETTNFHDTDLATSMINAAEGRIANHNDTPVSKLEELMKNSENQEIRNITKRVWASRIQAPQERLMELSRSTDGEIRAGVAKNLNTPEEILKTLVHDSEYQVRENAKAEMARRQADPPSTR